MSIDASELNLRIRQRPVLGRIYLAVALVGLVIALMGMLIFGTIYKSGSAALEEARYHLRTTVRDGRDLITWTVRHICNRWDDGESGKSDS